MYNILILFFRNLQPIAFEVFKGVFELDSLSIYLTYDTNKKIADFPTYIYILLIQYLIGFVCYLLKISPISLQGGLFFILGIIVLYFILGVYGTNTGDFICLAVDKQTTFKCVHFLRRVLPLSEWFIKFTAISIYRIVYIEVVIRCLYLNILNDPISIVILVLLEAPLFAYFTYQYFKSIDNDCITVSPEDTLVIKLKAVSNYTISYKIKDVILTVQKNNDILLRNRHYPYYTTKMDIIPADTIDSIQIENKRIALKDSKWSLIN